MFLLRRFDQWVIAKVQKRLRRQNKRLVRIFAERNNAAPNIALPQRYAEMMMWRKLVDRNPLYVLFSDKLATKDYIRKLCPEISIPQTLWVGKAVREIPQELFEKGDTWFKANHGSTYNLMCPQGAPDYPEMTASAERWLISKWGATGGEWTYSLVEPRLFLEESIKLEGRDLIEFQIRAGMGKVLMGSVTGQTKTPAQWHYYVDVQGQQLTDPVLAEKGVIDQVMPFQELVDPYFRAMRYSEALSHEADYVRCDFFWNGEQLYAGDMTVFPAGGYKDLLPELDPLVRAGWDLRNSHFLRTPQRGWRRLYRAAMLRRWTPALSL